MPIKRDPNLQRLFWLRNVLIISTIFAVASYSWWQDTLLPVIPIAALVALTGAMNLLTLLWLRVGKVASNPELFLQLSIDTLIFTGLMYITGGATNPFVWFYILPIMISATLLPKSYTWTLTTAAIIFYSLLMFYFIPLPDPQILGSQHHLSHGSAFSQHIFGMWFGFVFSAILVAWLVVDLAESIRDRDRHLALAREHALQDEKIIAMGTLAAGAAHELGTPLSTMAIIIEQLLKKQTEHKDPSIDKKLGILKSQIDRCKKAISVISASAGEARAEEGSAINTVLFLKLVLENWQSSHPEIKLDYSSSKHTQAGRIVADKTVTQAFQTVLDNAADVSLKLVKVSASVTQEQLKFMVTDEGEGLEHNNSDLIGKVPFTNKDQGMGIGLFLAHATVRRMGGGISHEKTQQGKGLTIITLPLLPETQTQG